VDRIGRREARSVHADVKVLKQQDVTDGEMSVAAISHVKTDHPTDSLRHCRTSSEKNSDS
jgi:hypothetical protein